MVSKVWAHAIFEPLAYKRNREMSREKTKVPQVLTIIKCLRFTTHNLKASLIIITFLLLSLCLLHIKVSNWTSTAIDALEEISTKHDLLVGNKLDAVSKASDVLAESADPLEALHTRECKRNLTIWTERMNMMKRVYASQSASKKFYKFFQSNCQAYMYKQFCSRKADAQLIQRKCIQAKEMRFLTESEAKERGLFVLASYPGSGNTWVRLILEELTGIFTGSVYCDAQLALGGQFGEGCHTKETIAVKCHGSVYTGVTTIEEQPTSVIYLVRNPYHAILSCHSYHLTRSHIISMKINSMNDSQVQKAADVWLESTRTWVNNSAWKVTVISYDALVSDFAHEVQKFVSALDFPVKQESIDCLKENSMDTYVRNKQKGKNPFSKEQQRIIRQAILSMSSILKQHNIDYKRWTW